MNAAQFIHAGISAVDLDRAVRWYAAYFGFIESKRFEKPALEIKAAVLTLGEMTLEILAPYNPVPASVGENSLVENLRSCGSNHLAFSVSDVNGLFSRMKDDGVTLVSDLIDGRLFFCKDSDGTLLEIKQQ